MITATLFGQSVFTVTKTTDVNPFVHQFNNDDNLCDPEMYGTLQWAINKANFNPDESIIEFNIPGTGTQNITLLSYLPQLIAPVVLDASTQTGYSSGNPVIRINGENITQSCFSVYNCRVTIKGFQMENFNQNAIYLRIADSSEIIENVINSNSNALSYSDAIGFSESNGVKLYGNVFKDENDDPNAINYGYGFYMKYSNNCIIGGTEEGQVNIFQNCNTAISLGECHQVKISGNLIFNNNTAFIFHNEANNGIQPPEILDYQNGILTGTALPNSTIEVFGSTGSENANEYLISTIANENGDWSIEISTSYEFFVATQTDLNNNTSGFKSVKFCVSPEITVDISFSHGLYVTETEWSPPEPSIGTATVEHYFICQDVEPFYIYDSNELTGLAPQFANWWCGDCSVWDADYDGGTLENYNYYCNEPQIDDDCHFNLIYDPTLGQIIEFDPNQHNPGTYILNAQYDDECQIRRVYITILEAPDPTITPVGPFCENDASVTLQAVDDGGTWSGNGVNPITGEFDPSIGPGNYTINYYVEVDGCSDEDEITITVYESPDPELEDVYVCINGSATLFTDEEHPDAIESYSWSGPNGDGPNSNTWFLENVQPSMEGEYIVTVTFEYDDISCTETGTTSLYIYDDPVISFNDPTICNGNPTPLTANGGISFSWEDELENPLGNTQTINITEPGTYSVTVTDSHGCTTESSIYVPESNLELVSSVIMPTCPDDNTGSISVVVDNGIMPYEYDWEGPNSPLPNSPDLSNLSFGTYNLTVTDYSGCEITASFDVDEVNLPDITFENIHPTCEWQSYNGSATVIVENGDGASYIYDWYQYSNYLGSGQIADFLNFGYNTVIVTDNFGCSTSAEVGIDLVNLQLSVTTDNTILCLGSGITPTLTATASNGDVPYTYLWNDGNIDISTENVITVSPEVTTEYFVTVTDDYGCSANESITIDVVGIEVIIKDDEAICFGQSVNIGAYVEGIEIETWSWSPSESLDDPSAQYPIATPTETTTYTVTATDFNGCEGTADLVVTVYPLPLITISGIVEVCAGYEFQLEASGAVEYFWESSSSSATISDTEIANPMITINETSTFTVSGWSEHGCKGIAEITVTALDNPEPELVYNDHVCIGNDIIIDLTNEVFNAYSWAGPDGYNSTNPDVVINNITELNAGTYTVIVEYSNGCTNTAVVNIETHSFIAYAGNNSPCVGDELHLAARPINMDSYHWEGPDGYYADYDISEHHVPDATLDMAGTYYVTITDHYGCTASAQTIVTVHANPLVDLGSDVLICIGESINLGENLVITGAETNIFEWSPPDWINDDITIANPNASPEESIVYTLVATDIYGCSGTDDIAITVDEILNLSATSNSPVCENGELHLYAQPDGLSYQWTGLSGYSSTEQNPVVTSSADPDFHAGIYTLTVENMNECSSTISIDIEINPVPDVVVGPNQTICEGTELSLTGGIDGLIEYHWTGPNGYESFEQNPTVSLSATSLMEGTYTLVGSNEFDCTAEASCYIEIKPTPTEASFDLPDCIYVFNDYQFINLGNNNDSFEYTWDFGDGGVSNEASPVHEFRSEGYHCLTLTVENECGISTYSTEPLFLYPNECACNNQYDAEYVPISGSDEYWDPAIMTVKKDVIIQSGAKLTVSNQTIQFGPEGRILVMQGGELDIQYGTTLRGLESCNNMWQGVEVWGDHASESDADIQGVFISGKLTNVIQDAHIAILAGARNMANLCEFDLENAFINDYSGGMIYNAQNLTLANNGIGIKFLPKDNNYISTCGPNGIVGITIESEDGGLSDVNYNSVLGPNPYPNIHNKWAGKANNLQRTDVGIWMDNIKLNKLDNSKFSYINYGILSYNSYYNVYRSAFEHNVYGIRIENRNSSLETGHEISGCNFSYNKGTGEDNFEDMTSSGIFINSSLNDLIQGNTFGTDLSLQNQNNIGIFTLNALSLTIQQNKFDKLKIGIYTGNLLFFQPLSAYPTNRIRAWTSPLYDVTEMPSWSGNTFKRCRTSINTFLINSNLQLKCNNCSNNYEDFDQYYANFYNVGIMANIGAPPTGFHFFDVKRPGGNEFLPDLSQYNGFYKSIWSDHDYEYYAHAGPSKVIPTSHYESEIDMEQHIHTSNAQKPSNSLACSPFFQIDPIIIPIDLNPNPGGFGKYPYKYLDSLENQIDSLSLIKEDLLQSIDGGITQELLDDIYSNTSSGKLQNKLIDNSPLSDEVLYALLSEYPLSHGNFKNVMMLNLPVSEELTNFFYNVLEQIPRGISKQLIPLQGVNLDYNTVTAIDREVENMILERGDILSTLLNYLTDTINDNRDDALLILEKEKSDWAKATLVASYIQDGEFEKAREELLQFQSDDPLVTDFIDYQNMMIDIFEEGRTVYQLDSSETAFVRELAYKCPAGLASTNSQAILSLLYRENVPICPNIMSTRNLSISNDFNLNSDVYDKPVSDFVLGENYPDPASDYTIIPYTNDSGDNGIIEISDASGRAVYLFDVYEGNNQINIDTRTLQPGIYTYTYILENSEVISKKFIVYR